MNMRKSNSKKILIPGLLSLGLNLILITINFFSERANSPFYRPYYMFEAVYIFGVVSLLPLFTAVFFAIVPYFERIRGYDSYIYIRVKREDYLRDLYFQSMIWAFISILIPIVFLGLLNILFYEPLPQDLLGDNRDFLNMPLSNMYFNRPFLYFLLNGLWTAFIGVLYSSLSFIQAIYEDSPVRVFFFHIVVYFLGGIATSFFGGFNFNEIYNLISMLESKLLLLYLMIFIAFIVYDFKRKERERRKTYG